jgi:hypothetical protein
MTNKPTAFHSEQHYTIKELAKKWHYSYNYLRPHFENREDVLRTGHGEGMHTRKRVQLRIPESVAAEVYAKLHL